MTLPIHWLQQPEGYKQTDWMADSDMIDDHEVMCEE